MTNDKSGDRIEELTESEACVYVEELLGKEKAALWWKLPNPNFGGLIPSSLVERGRAKPVLQFISYAKWANNTAPDKKEMI